jgi:hypothetical protein
MAGKTMYYFGYYSYGASIAKSSKRATKMKHFDGTEGFAQLLLGESTKSTLGRPSRLATFT